MPKMSADVGPKFVSLKKEPMYGKDLVSTKPSMPSYPTLYLDKSIGIDDKDIGETLRAEIKFSPRRITRTESNGEKTISVDLEIQAIRVL